MQDILVYILVGIAAVSLIYQFVKPKNKKDCGKDCNCN